MCAFLSCDGLNGEVRRTGVPTHASLPPPPDRWCWTSFCVHVYVVQDAVGVRQPIDEDIYKGSVQSQACHVSLCRTRLSSASNRLCFRSRHVARRCLDSGSDGPKFIHGPCRPPKQLSERKCAPLTQHNTCLKNDCLQLLLPSRARSRQLKCSGNVARGPRST